jgi:hypothetical protein
VCLGLPDEGGHPFRDDIPNWDELCTSFQLWVDKMPPGICNIIPTVLPCADGLVVLAATENDDTNQSGGLTISHTMDGFLLLLDVNLKALPPRMVATLLEEFLHDAWSKFFFSSLRFW